MTGEVELYDGCIVKALPALRLAGLSEVMEMGVVGERVGPLFERVADLLHEEPESLELPIATYGPVEGGMQVVVGFVRDDEAPEGLEDIELPASEVAACTLHLGPVSGVFATWQRLHHWTEAEGFTLQWPSREVYVRSESADQRDWVTELQQPASTSPAGQG